MSSSFNSVPNVIVGAIASYLNQKEYGRFSRCSKSIENITNFPNTLQHIEINEKMDYNKINFAKYLQLKQITFIDSSSCDNSINVNNQIDEDNVNNTRYNLYQYNMKRPDIVIPNLLNMQSVEIRDISMIFIKSVIDKISNNGDNNNSYSKEQKYIKINAIIDILLSELNNALIICDNDQLVDYQNNSFPDDLKNYTERMPKLDKYLIIIWDLIKKFPEQTINKLSNKENWTLICKIITALDKNSILFNCGKNDDKLSFLNLCYTLINQYHILPQILFNDLLIDTLTSQYLIAPQSIRSQYCCNNNNILNTQIENLWCITYRLLTYFGGDDILQCESYLDDHNHNDHNNDNNEEEEVQAQVHDDVHNIVKDGDGNDNNDNNTNKGELEFEFIWNDNKKEHWIKSKIVNSPWFLQSVSEIVVPDNAFRSNNNNCVANDIINFISSIINTKYMKKGRNQIIRTICNKWTELGSTQYNMRHYPRESVFKLLTVVLRNKSDHQLFINKSGFKLLQKWIDTFILTDSFSLNLNQNQEESIRTISAGLDFFIFHVMETCKYYLLLTHSQDMLAMIDIYIQVIIKIFSKCYTGSNNNEPNEQYDIITNKAILLLRRIFDFDMKQFPSSRFIMSRFLKRMSNQLLPFPQSQMKYNLDSLSQSQSASLSDSEVEIVKHLQDINKSAESIDNAQIYLNSKQCLFETDKQVYAQRISPLFSVFLEYYVNTEKFYWRDDKFGGNTRSYLTDIMITCWFLRVIGCTNNDLPQIINKNVDIYLNDICLNQKGGGLNTTITWMVYCNLITSSTFNNLMLCNDLNMNIFLLMTKSVLESVSSEQFIEALILSDTIHKLKKNTFMKYIPLRVENCIDLLIIDSKYDNKKKSALNELAIFLQFYCNGLCYKDVIDCCIKDGDKKWWFNLSLKITKLVHILNDSNDKPQIIEYLYKISKLIKCSMKSMNDDIVENECDLL